MLSVATSSLSALPSTLRESFSRNMSDNEQQSREASEESQKQPEPNKPESTTSSRSNDSNGSFTPNSFRTPAIVLPSVDQQQKTDEVDGSTTWQDNLAGSRPPPTTNLDTTTITTTTNSNSPASLNLDHFDFKNDEVGTPTVEDNSFQFPLVNPLDDHNATQNQPQNNSNSYEINIGRRAFRLPTKKLKKKRSASRTDSVPDDASYLDSPPIGSFAPANPKRNAEFHTLFRSVPEEDYLINDYGCALQKEILVQGRLYVSRNHLCFNANIFGWVTNLVIAFTDIVSIEKKMTAFVIPNAISVSTLHAKHFFTSFLSRDTACELLLAMWRQTHPAITFTNFVESEYAPNGGTEESNGSSDSSAESSEEGKSTDVRRKFGLPKLTLHPIKFIRGNGTVLSEDERQVQNKLDQHETKVQSLPSSPQKSEFDEKSLLKGPKGHRPRSRSVAGIQPPVSDLPVSETHSQTSPRTQSRNSIRVGITAKKRRQPTQCACLKNRQHYNTVSSDTKLTGTVEKLYNLLFTSEFVNRFISEEEKCSVVSIGEWKTVDSKLTRSSSYIKPLNNSIGPKSAKCCIKDEVLHRDFDNYVTIISTTTTPDVPSGNSFCVKTRTCIMWAGPNETRIIITCAVEWSKSSWLKGTIESACFEGQAGYWKSLMQYIKKYIAVHPSEFKDESVSPGRERVDEDLPEMDEKIQKERSRSISMPPESSSLEQAEPTRAQRQAAGLWNVVFEIPSILYSILTPMVQNLSVPSANIMIILAIFFMMIANMYNLLLLRDIWKRLDNVAGGISSITHNRKNEFLHESRGQQAIFSMFDDRIESEGDVLWQWLTEKSQRYERSQNSHQDDEDDAISSPSPSSNSQTDSSSFGCSNDHCIREHKSSQDMYEEIGDLHKMLRSAESRARKLIDVAEYESAYYREQEGKMKKQHDPRTEV